jgi:hypothetical protein
VSGLAASDVFRPNFWDAPTYEGSGRKELVRIFYRRFKLTSRFVA